MKEFLTKNYDHALSLSLSSVHQLHEDQKEFQTPGEKVTGLRVRESAEDQVPDSGLLIISMIISSFDDRRMMIKRTG